MDTTTVARDVIGKFFYIGGVLQREGNRLLQPFGLNQQQFQLAYEIGKVGPIRQKDVIEQLRLEKAHVSKSVKKLQSMGLIAVDRSTEDRRSTWLSVTADGAELLEKAEKQFCQWNEQWFDQMTQDELLLLNDTLSTIEDLFYKKLTDNEGYRSK